MRILTQTCRCAALAALLALPQIANAYSIHGHVTCKARDFPLYGGEVRAYEIDPVAGGPFASNLLFFTTIDTKGDFSATIPWPVSNRGFEAGDPDLVFEVRQRIDTAVETVYQEPVSAVRWNVRNGASFHLTTESPLAICPDPAAPTVTADRTFVFSRIGAAPVAEIDCKGNDANAGGYWRPRKHGFGGELTDQPFGATLDVFGWFGKLANVSAYKLQLSANGGTTWTDVDTPLPNYWLDTAAADPHWVYQSMGPFTAGGQTNLYRLPTVVHPDTPWAWLDRVGRFDTTRTLNGLTRLRILAFKGPETAPVPVAPGDLTIPAGFGEIQLQVDNTPPFVKINAVKLDGVPTKACGILVFGPRSPLGVDYQVFDARGHLLSYTLDALYGHACAVTPRPATPNPAHDGYDHNAAASPAWQGSLSYSTEYAETNYTLPCTSACSAQQMPSCAYQLRLSATKRTTDGYTLIYHDVEDTWHVTLQHPGKECAQ